jgi:beta-glucosidase
VDVLPNPDDSGKDLGVFNIASALPQTAAPAFGAALLVDEPHPEVEESGMTVQEDVEKLLAQMTPAEKAGQLTQYFYFRLPPDAPRPVLEFDRDEQPRMVEARLGEGLVGSLLFLTDPTEINRLQRLAVEGNRFGIPALVGLDVVHGLRTVFPVPIAMAASWDLEVIEAGQEVAAREARAVGIHWAFAPMVDIARDPRWGRIIEGAGEDPYLGAAVAAAQVRGFQGPAVGSPERIIAGPKHFAGYGYALGGRDYDEVNLSDSELWNVVLPPFRAAIEAGAGNVMTAYMDLNGIPATGSGWLFTDLLRGTLGFDGFVVSDANAVRNLLTHGFAADLTDAGARAVNAGVDMEMAISDAAYAHLPEALVSGAPTPRRPGARRCSRRSPAAHPQREPRGPRPPVRARRPSMTRRRRRRGPATPGARCSASRHRRSARCRR